MGKTNQKKKAAPAFKSLVAATDRRPARRLTVYYKGGKQRTYTGVYLGFLPRPADAISLEGEDRGPAIELTEPINGGVMLESEFSESVIQGTPRLTAMATDTDDPDAKKFMVRAGTVIELPASAVVIDADASDLTRLVPPTNKNQPHRYNIDIEQIVLYAPEPGSSPDDILWPARVVLNRDFPRTMPFSEPGVDDNPPSYRYRYFGQDGTSGVVTGRIGFLMVKNHAGTDTFNIYNGIVPGWPAMIVTEDADPPDIQPPTGLNKAVATRHGFGSMVSDIKSDADEVRGMAQKLLNANYQQPDLIKRAKDFANSLIPAGTIFPLPASWVILNETENTIQYFPPADSDKWPARVVGVNRFPEGVKFAGTDFLVSEFPEGPPLTECRPNSGFFGYNEASLYRGNVCVAAYEPMTDIGFPDADALRWSLARNYEIHRSTAVRFTSFSRGDKWEPVAAVLDNPAPLANIITAGLNTADIVLWDYDLTEEAVGPELPEGGREIIEQWKGKPLPYALLREMRRPQFHVFRENDTRADTEEMRELWGLDVPCHFVGLLTVPMFLVESERDEKLWRSRARGDKFGERPALAACFFFIPVAPPTTAPTAPFFYCHKDGLLPADGFFRTRWFKPLVCDDANIYHAYAQVAALLDFMTSPRVEVNPTLAPEEEADAPAPTPAKPRPFQPDAPRYLTLRRVKIAADVLEGLGIGDTAGTGRALEESHYRAAYTRKVHYGPGRKFVKTVAVKRYQVRKDLPLQPDAEAKVEAREKAKRTTFIRVVQ